MKATVQFAKDMTFIGKGNSGHWITMDSADNVGGSDSATRPMELLLIGLAGCTAMDVVSILRKKRVQFSDFWVECNATQAKEHPKVFTNIIMTYHIAGKGVKERDVERAVELSKDKYCSAHTMFHQVVPIEIRIEIHED